MPVVVNQPQNNTPNNNNDDSQANDMYMNKTGLSVSDIDYEQ